MMISFMNKSSDIPFYTVLLLSRLMRVHTSSEASLDGVETLLRSLRRRVRRVDADILSSVRRQSLGGSKAKMDLESATKAISELQGRVIDIKVKVSVNNCNVYLVFESFM